MGMTQTFVMDQFKDVLCDQVWQATFGNSLADPKTGRGMHRAILFMGIKFDAIS